MHYSPLSMVRSAINLLLFWPESPTSKDLFKGYTRDISAWENPRRPEDSKSAKLQSGARWSKDRGCCCMVGFRHVAITWFVTNCPDCRKPWRVPERPTSL